MTKAASLGWRDVRAEACSRIECGTWKPGERIPNEADLASELGCARTTVNRALRDLAEQGILERRRRGGTRVPAAPVHRATLAIPIIRLEVEATGATHGYRLLLLHRCTPTQELQESHALDGAEDMLRVRALHFSDRRPYVHEDRWIVVGSVPEVLKADLEVMSANEWLVRNVPLVRSKFEFGAVAVSGREAAILKTSTGAPSILLNRATWNRDGLITAVRLVYAPGHRVRLTLEQR